MREMVTVIRDGELVRISREQAEEEDLFIIGQEVEKKVDEMKQTIKMPVNERRQYSLDYKNNNVMNELVEHFNWKISRARRDRNFSRRQLADAAKVSESEIMMLENGQLPKDDFVIIKKVEEALRINLRKNPSIDRPMSAQPTLADLQKRREQKAKESPLSGSEIEILD